MSTVILSAARTPFGKVGGGLAPVSAVELGKTAAKAAIERAGVEPGDFDYTVFGQVIQAGVGHIPSRQVSRGVGIPDEIGSDTVNKVCASGMRAATLGDQFIRAGDHELLLVGGMESMSNAPYLLTKGRYGYRFGDAEIEDAMLQDALRDPWSGLLMYYQSGQIATELGIEREDLDAWAVRSHERAVAAIDGGQMGEEIAAVEIEGRKGTTTVDTDEGPRRDTSLEKLRALRPLVKDHPTHTAGNSPGVNDGAAALVVASEEYAEKHGLTPLARFRGIGYTANRHDSLARVPAAAAQIALQKAGLSVDDVDRFEVNEAFASVALQSAHDLGADPDKVNLQGGAIALGHPVGASGARLLTTLIYQLRRQGGGIGVAAICSGGGQGDAAVLEVFGE